jgi:hypothetical protein
VRGLVVIAALAACEAQPHVHVTFRGAALDPAKLHVDELTEPGSNWYPAGPISKRAVDGGVEMEIQLSIGPRQYVHLRGWYDANGNGTRDANEPGGELGSAFEARDSGGCRPRDANRTPDIVLVPGGAPEAGRPTGSDAP